MFPRLITLSLAVAAVPLGAARAQVSTLSTLWREWAVLEAEWRAERQVFPRDRAQNARVRDALATGADPRLAPRTPVRRPAGPAREVETRP